jgi:hypothetical protein
LLISAACKLGQPFVDTLEVTRVVREPYIITAEVTRLVRKPKIVTAEVTRIVRETVLVTPAPLDKWAIDVAGGINLSLPRTWHTATRLKDQRILLVGGSNGMDDHYAIVEILDPLIGMLNPAAPLHTARSGHTATLLTDGRVLVVGGYNYFDQWLVDAELYNPAADAWTILPPTYSHGVQHTATLMNDGRVLVAGGCIASGVCTGRVEIFDPSTDTWLEVASLPMDLASHAALLLEDGRVLAAGGAGSIGYPPGGVAFLYDPQTNVWSETGPMVLPRAQAVMIKLLDGRALLAGGLTIGENPVILADVEIYNPASNTWSAAAPLMQPRYAFLLALLPDSQPMAVGGARNYDHPYNVPWTAASFIREIECFTPLLKRWYVAGELPQPITYAAAEYLPDGRLWLTGGGAGHAVATAWAETWILTPLIDSE